MAKVEIKTPFPGKDSGECYQASLRMVEKAGYHIFKKREIASLVICEGMVGGHKTELSVMVPFGFPTSVVISLASEEGNENALTEEGNRLVSLLSKELKV